MTDYWLIITEDECVYSYCILDVSLWQAIFEPYRISLVPLSSLNQPQIRQELCDVRLTGLLIPCLPYETQSNRSHQRGDDLVGDGPHWISLP